MNQMNTFNRLANLQIVNVYLDTILKGLLIILLVVANIWLIKKLRNVNIH